MQRGRFGLSLAVVAGLAVVGSVSPSSAQDATALAATTTSPAPAPGFDLADALVAMRARHPALVAARLGVAAARSDETATGLWTNPIVSGLWTPGILHSTYDAAGYVTWGVSQFLELADTPGARRRAAASLVRAAEEDREATTQGLAIELEAAAVELAVARQRREVTTRYAEALTEVARVVDLRVTAGAAPQYDASRVAIALASARADLAESEADVARAQGELRAAIGPGVDTLSGELRFDPEDAPSLPDVASLLAILTDERPDLRSLRHEAEAASATIDVARRSVFPGVTLTVGGAFGNGPGQVDLGLGLAVPLPIVDVGQGTISAAQARADAASAVVDVIAIPTRERISAIHREITLRRDALAAYRAASVTAGDAMLTEARAGYETGGAAGRFSILELADAFAAWRDARLREVELIEGARLAEIDLGRALGRSLRAPQGANP